MAKRATYNKPKKKLTFLDIVKGNFLNRDEVKVHYKYFLLIFALMMIMIYSNHLVSKKIERDIYGNYTKAFELLKSKAIIPTVEEIEQNSRARSAKMRVGIKI